MCRAATRTLCAVTRTGSLDTINPRYPLTGGGAAESAIDGLLCVQYDNSGSKGEFLEVIGWNCGVLLLTHATAGVHRYFSEVSSYFSQKLIQGQKKSQCATG